MEPTHQPLQPLMTYRTSLPTGRKKTRMITVLIGAVVLLGGVLAWVILRGENRTPTPDQVMEQLQQQAKPAAPAAQQKAELDRLQKASAPTPSPDARAQTLNNLQSL